MNQSDLFLSNAQTFILFPELFLGVILVFVAILAWRKTDENYIMFFILGVLFQYTNILYKTVSQLGFITKKILVIKDIPIGFLIFENLPLVFFILAFLLFIKSKKF